VSLCLLKAASGDAAVFRAAGCSWTGITTIGFTVADAKNCKIMDVMEWRMR
jgi:hypothetical protein